MFPGRCVRFRWVSLWLPVWCAACRLQSWLDLPHKSNVRIGRQSAKYGINKRKVADVDDVLVVSLRKRTMHIGYFRPSSLLPATQFSTHLVNASQQKCFCFWQMKFWAAYVCLPPKALSSALLSLEHLMKRSSVTEWLAAIIDSSRPIGWEGAVNRAA